MLSKEQILRKSRSEKILEQAEIKINKNLPCIESETDTILRTPEEIARRVSVLAINNLVAFNYFSAEEAIDYLKKYNLWDFVTDNERGFLANPTEEKKNNETWKCEGIWTLMWALNKVTALGPPDELCSLDNISPENYPIGEEKDPNVFINSISSTRTKGQILDANDLYYRLDWACVDARINNIQIEGAHPGIVLERHYALNWLINYMGQDWDYVTCDT